MSGRDSNLGEGTKVPLFKAIAAGVFVVSAAISAGGLGVSIQRDIGDLKRDSSEVRREVGEMRVALDNGFCSLKDMKTWIRLWRAGNGNNGVKVPEWPTSNVNNPDDR